MAHVSYNVDCPDVYSFDKISAADHGFDKFFLLSEVLFSFFFSLSTMLDVVRIQYYKYSLPKHSDTFLTRQFYSFCFFLFSYF